MYFKPYYVNNMVYTPVQKMTFGKFFNVLKEVCNTYKDCIYLIKNTVKKYMKYYYNLK